jgi:DNA mismatch repair protein MutS2
MVVDQLSSLRVPSMNEHDLRILEFPKIIERLAEHTAFSASRELALRLRPLNDEDEVRRRLQETTEAKALTAVRTDVSVGGAHDVRQLAHHASLGGRLHPADLLDIRYTLESARTLGRLIVRLKDDYPLLAEIAWEIQPLTGIIDEIIRCLDDEGRVLDSASPTLTHLRRESRIARDRLMDRLRRILTNSDYATYLQDPIITERNGRYVIPLKVQYRGKIEGIIHDQSSSGATLFIEPLATVELNNQWHELQLAEQREVDRILLALSEVVGQDEPAISTNVAALAYLDLAFAKARYSFQLRATPADLVEAHWPLRAPTADHAETLAPSEHPLHLINARHPLLPAASVVPISVYMGGDYTTLLVTGPNTGGKTVTLKTVGLLAAMSQAGLHIPATPGSRLPVFTGIFADIGDEQSIEQSLSTFSSHMTRIVEILAQVDDQALVLLDELGAGTDPAEGAPLAQAIINRLLATGCLAVCSTHYSQLKVFAYGTSGVLNASVEFDLETLSPTYRLLIGLPGRSNAIAIAQRLGLDSRIIAEASELLSPDALETDELLDRVKRASEAAELALRYAEQSRKQAQEHQEQLRIKLANIEEARRQVLNEARAEGRRELEQVSAVVRQLRNGLLASAPDGRAVEAIRETIERLEKSLEPLAPVAPLAPRNTRRLLEGDTVRVNTLGQEGELLSLEGGEAEVRLGSLRLRTELASLSFVARSEAIESAATVRAGLPTVSSPGMEIDLRGLRADEVTSAANQYLDSAYLSGLPWVHLIHGKGNGVLKQVVRDLLRSHPLIDSFRPGEIAEGGDGITVVKLHKVSN